MSKGGNKRKDVLLGEPHGTATARLRKMVLFGLLQRAGEDTCYRCRQRIDTVQELSIEHMESWQLAVNPREAFFDLSNVAFSHLRCNVAASAENRHVPERREHGINGYRRGCRCETCKAAKASDNAHRSSVDGKRFWSSGS